MYTVNAGRAKATERLPRIGAGLTGDRGVAIVGEIVNKPRTQGGLGCLFRPLPIADYGIDGQIEIVDLDDCGQEVASGKILSIQIKTGPSYFSNASDDAWSVYIPKSTFEYWLSHSVPVLLVLVDPSTSVCYWVRADDDEHEETKENYKVSIPKANILNADSFEDIQQIALYATETDRRLAILDAGLPLMKLINEGADVRAEVTVWVNKSSGRKDVTIGTVNEYRLNALTEFMSLGPTSPVAMLQRLYPWAEYRMP